MKKILVFSLIMMLFGIGFSWAEEKEDKETAITQITDRCTKYMTAVKYQDWDDAYTYISSRTNKEEFVRNMKEYWEGDVKNNPNPPKILGFYIDKIKFNDHLDEAEVWFTQKLNFWQGKSGWKEQEHPRIYIWIKEADGQWYRDYGNSKQRIK